MFLILFVENGITKILLYGEKTKGCAVKGYRE